MSGIGEACGIGEDYFMGTCYSGLSCNLGLCNIPCNVGIYESCKNKKTVSCTQAFYLLIAALYDILPNVEIRIDDEPGKIYHE